MLSVYRSKKNILLYVCIDRITGEQTGYLAQKLISNGASNVNFLTGLGKKGRVVYIAFIDVKKDLLDKILPILVFEFNVTGWYVISDYHEYVEVKEEKEEIDLKINDKNIKLWVPFKFIRDNGGKVLILLEHDYCSKLLETTLKEWQIDLTYCELSSLLKNEILKRLTF